ncbi:glycosyltransferase family 1 protein [Raoultella sp. WB_B2P2-3]|uniref:glycosyltransferase family 4 protein n=1 Tax=Raoultella scottii TaxID=3040937 RepID=UPI002F95F6B4
MKKKQIFFDARWLGDHGIGRFAKEIRQLKLDVQDVRLPWKPTNPFDTLLLSIYLFFKPGIYFSPGYNAPLFFLGRSVITIHDLNHIDIPYNSSFLKRVYYKLILKRACKKALCILTVSEFSKKRICEWSGRSEEDVFVVGNGVSKEFFTNEATLKKEQILIVGNRKKHKNELNALKAFDNSNIPSSVKLVFTGKISPELDGYINQNGLRDRVSFLGTVSNAKLSELYRESFFLLFPSLYEGFGLPIVESMACGTPTIISNSTSLPEVAGGAAIMVNPDDVEDIKNNIEKLYYDLELQQELVGKGFCNIQRYTWEMTRAKIEQIMSRYI